MAISIITAAPADEVKPVTVRPGILGYKDLDYGGNGNKRQMLDLYVPADSKEPLPVVAWFHGGGWQVGDKSDVSCMDLPRYISSGYAVVSVNYRFSTQAVFPAQIEDCKAAIRFLRANADKYNLDAGHIGVWGISAGGHLAALLGTSNGVKDLEGAVGKYPGTRSEVQAVVPLSTPTDLTMPGQPNSLMDCFNQIVGGSVEKNRAVAVKASPITYVGKNSAPMLIVHGQADDIVPIKHAEILEAALKKAGVEVRLLSLKDTGHTGARLFAPDTRKEIADFFDRHLKPEQATPKRTSADNE